MIVAIAALYNKDNGYKSSHVKVFSYTSSTNTWDILGSPIVGVALDDRFRLSVSLLSDGIIVAIVAVYNGDNGFWSGHMRVFFYASSTNI